MKNKILKLVFVLIAIFATIYIFLPDFNTIEFTKHFNIPVKTVNRLTAQSQYRAKWLPYEKVEANKNKVLIDDCLFNFKSDDFLNVHLGVAYKKHHLSNNIITTKDSLGSTLYIQYTINNSSFFNKLSNYFAQKKIKHSLDQLFNHLDRFVANTKNIYGTTMRSSILKDSTLISIKESYQQYPTVANIYQNIRLLEKYAMANNAKQTNSPMLNITKISSLNYELMVALPINRFLNNSGKIEAKRLLAGGNILETDSIFGGFATVDAVFKELTNFKNDLNVIPPAIPFQLLITDRSKELDTSKWITKLYYPIF